MKPKRLLLLCLLLSATAVLTAQDFQTIDRRDGLSESRIRALCQLPDGRVAVATTATIDLYDGTRFECHQLPPDKAYPLPDYHGGHQMTADSEGCLWLRNNRTLYVLDTHCGRVVANVDSVMKLRGWTAGSIAQWPKKPVQKEMMGLTQIKDTLHDSYGGLWVGTQENGICYSNPQRSRQFHTSTRHFEHARRAQFSTPRTSLLAAEHAPDATNCTLDSRRMGYAFLGTRQGVMIFNASDSLVAVIDQRHGLASDIVQSIVIDSQSRLWVATACGISRLQVVGRDSFSIVNYGRLDGIRLDGGEFRDNQMALADDGRIEVGFAGGMVSFCPDSVCAPRYTFRFPNGQQQPTATPGHSLPAQLWMWLAIAALLAVAGLTLYIYSRRKQPPVKHANAARQQRSANIEQMRSLDETFNRIASEANPLNDDEQFLAKLKQAVEEHLDEEDFSVQQLSDLMAMDRTVLYRRMQALTGLSPSVYLKNVRMTVAARLLKETTIPVAEIAYKTGFSTTKYFNKVFKEHYGLSPADYRAQ